MSDLSTTVGRFPPMTSTLSRSFICDSSSVRNILGGRLEFPLVRADSNGEIYYGEIFFHRMLDLYDLSPGDGLCSSS